MRALETLLAPFEALSRGIRRPLRESDRQTEDLFERLDRRIVVPFEELDREITRLCKELDRRISRAWRH